MDWKPEVRSLIKTLEKHEVEILAIDNGEEVTEKKKVKTTQFIDECVACDEAWLVVQTKAGKKTLYLVFGNSPGELVCDYSVDPQLDVATDEHYNKWESRKQPTKTEEYKSLY